jgi:hypothetical protein
MEKLKELTLHRKELETELRKEVPCFMFGSDEAKEAYFKKESKVKEIQKEIDELILNS